MNILKQLSNSLAFKIGAAIVLTVIIVLFVMGLVYTNRFSNQVDEHIEAQVQIPGTLMNAGLLSLDSVTDREMMRELIGEELEDGMVVGINNNVFYSLTQITWV